MGQAQGDLVAVHYTGRLANGEQFDSSEGHAPLEFEIGSGMVIPGFDEAVANLEVGEKTTVTIPVDQAYGPRMDELINDVPPEFFQGNIPEEGTVISLQSPEGHVIAATVVKVADDKITLDLNHPLAGEELTFDLELLQNRGKMEDNYGS